MYDEFFKGVKNEQYELSSGMRAELPIEYYDLTWINAAFPAPASKVEKILPSGKLKPLLLFPGIALVQIGAYEYKDIRGLAPYNELAISIPVQYEPKKNYPGMMLLHFPLYSPGSYSRFGSYVHKLPVTTQEACEGGVEIWGFPKTVADIIFDDEGIYCRCTLRSSGKDVISLKFKKMRTSFRRLEMHCFTIKDDKLLRTPIQMQGEFCITRMPGGATLELGEGSIADELRTLGLGRTAMGRIYATRSQCMLHAGNESLGM